MNALKCDTCGAPLELSEDKTHAICKFCGNTLLFTEADEGAASFMENLSKERLLTRAYTKLEELNEKDAEELFERALNLDPECAEAYWGQMLARHGCLSTKDFIQQQIQKSHNAQLLSLSPFPEENEAEIKKAVDTYTSDGLLTEDEIRSVFVFHEDYLSLLDSREYLYDQTISFFNNDKYVTRALQYADENFRAEILSAKSQILSAIKEDIESAREHDKEALEQLKKPFQEYINTAHKKADELLRSARKKQADTPPQTHLRANIPEKKQRPSYNDFSIFEKLKIIFAILLAIYLIITSWI